MDEKEILSEFFSPAEIGEILNFHSSTIYFWIKEGLYPFQQLDRIRLIPYRRKPIMIRGDGLKKFLIAVGKERDWQDFCKIASYQNNSITFE